jgi:Ca2+/H+ antiporter, TMEM165/GDT1 family
VAVTGGRWLSTKISVKHGQPSRSSDLFRALTLPNTVTLGGACLFLLFSVIYLYEAWTADDSNHLLAPAFSDLKPTAPP